MYRSKGLSPRKIFGVMESELHISAKWHRFNTYRDEFYVYIPYILVPALQSSCMAIPDQPEATLQADTWKRGKVGSPEDDMESDVRPRRTYIIEHLEVSLLQRRHVEFVARL